MAQVAHETRRVTPPTAAARAPRLRGARHGGSCARGIDPGRALALQRLAGNRATSAAILQRREQGSSLQDPLYSADRRWSSGQGPDDRVTGRRLQNWAIAVGSAVLRLESTLMRLQVSDEGVESSIIDDVYSLLIDLLRGDSARDTQQTLVGTARWPYDEVDEVRRTLGHLGRFEGSDNAREQAVLELGDHWEPIAHYLSHALARVYRDAALDALARTPKGMDLVTDTDEIARLRAGRLHNHEHIIPQAGFSDAILRAGQRFGRVDVVDVYKSLGSRSSGPGTVWTTVHGHPLWYYEGSAALFDRNAFIGEVVRSVAEQAKFAALLFPYAIKWGGFALSFAPNPIMMIAGVLLSQLGEEGVRDVEGEGRSGGDIAKSAATEIVINLVFHKMFGGSGEASSVKAGEKLTLAAEKAAANARAAVEKEIVRTEAPQVVRKLEAGQAHRVENAALKDEGFIQEVNISHEGGAHTYRRRTDGTWCRWSPHRICLEMGQDVETAAARQLESGKGEITTDIDPRSEKLARQGRGERKTVYEVKKASADASDQAEVRMAELFEREGHKVHFNAHDAAGDITLDGIGADFKLLTQRGSINSAVERGAGQAPAVIIDGTAVGLTRAETEGLMRDLEAQTARHPGKYRKLETIYIVEGSAEHPTIYVNHRKGPPLRAPDPTHPTIRSSPGDRPAR